MNENAKKWVAALRSGKFKQGRHRLRIGHDYCCLGVACEVAIEEGLKVHRYEGEDGEYSYEESETYLPKSVREWLGLRNRIGVMRDGLSLAQFNDGGKTFAEIADIIESEPPGLFVEETTS